MSLWLDDGTQPAAAVDSCFDHQGNVIYAGDDAWDGILDEKPAGLCSRQFPVHATSRMLAGEDIRGDTLACKLNAVESAINDDTYGDIRFTENQVQRLNEIFPSGVCAY